MMRVMHVIPSMTVSYGGPSHALAMLVESLKNEHVDCEIAAVGSAGNVNVSCDVPVHYFESTWPHLFYFSNRLGHWLDEHVRNYDLIHVHSMFSFPSIAACRAARKNGVPYIVRPFGTLDAISRKQHSLRKLCSYHLIERANLSGASRIQVTSMKELRELNGLGFYDKCDMIPLGIKVDEGLRKKSQQPELFPHGETGSKVVLSLSRINPRKGIEILIQAMAKICRERSDVLLVIAGTGEEDYVASLKTLCAENNIEDKVIWFGEVSGARKQELLLRADIFTLISHGESFGLSVVEAMAAGIPVVISDQVAICDEISAAGAGLVVKRDFDDVAGSILQLLRDETIRKNTSAAGIRLVHEKYEIISSAKRVAEMYASVKGRL